MVQLAVAIDLTPDSLSMASPGATASLGARVADRGGARIVGAAVSWASRADSIATVDQSGVVTAVYAGTAWIVGSHETLQDSTKVTVSPPIRLSPARNRIAVGRGIACALDGGGGAHCWGDGRRGELGTGTVNSSDHAVPVAGGHSFSQISLDRHGCGVTSGGQVYCWGRNDDGQADPRQPGSDLLQPEAVPLPEPAAQVSVGAAHTCALTASGKAFCWGSNDVGELGLGYASPEEAPMPVTGGLTFVRITAGAAHSCALDAAGYAYCWGFSFYGALGVGPVNKLLVPTRVLGSQVFRDISAGSNGTCALDPSDAVHCWGGPGDPQHPHAPAPILGVSGVTHIDVGGPNACAVERGGTTYCWDDLALAPVPGGHTFTEVGIGAIGGCALDGSGDFYCWGDNAQGRLGNDMGPDVKVPVPVVGGNRFMRIAMEEGESCGLNLQGTALCWGGRFGLAGPSPQAGTLRFSEFSVGHAHQCGIEIAGPTYCWGEGSWGQLGDGTTNDRTAPVQVSTSELFAGITVGALHTCALDAQGLAFCWGRNSRGQLGMGQSGVDALVPVPVSGGLLMTELMSYGDDTCAVETSGRGICWGAAFGDAPVTIAAGQLLIDVSRGFDHYCYLDSQGEAWCAGSNWYGQLGDGTFRRSHTPAKVVGGHTFTSIAVDREFSCALTANGDVYCWGNNDVGQLGIGSNTRSTVPVRVQLPPGAARSISTGTHHVCALLNDDQVYCWGSNAQGKVGVPLLARSDDPVLVVGIP